MRALFAGLALWVAGTALIRLGGQRLLRPGHPFAIVLLYLVSFLLMALLIPRLCRHLGLRREFWPKAAALMILPTLILDAFACVFFGAVYPNLDPAAAGAFGGWMLICCGGGVAGGWRRT
ncbi:MAG TPA: DUF5367 family protein [Bryobacteraceae bacterium]|nr:DUF5367 family protein [Bryobacteraceae bacterium]